MITLFTLKGRHICACASTCMAFLIYSIRFYSALSGLDIGFFSSPRAMP